MRSAVIGLGRVGYEFGLDKKREDQPASHLACYQALPAIDEIAVCDLDPQKRGNLPSETKKVSSHWKDYDCMLKNFEPNVVSICTPTPTHKEIAVAAAQTSSVKAIFLEKPIASTVKDAKAIIEACKENNVRLTVNFTRRWNPVYASLKDSSFDFAVGMHPGPLLRTGVHMLDLFNLIFGEPKIVQAFGEPQDNYLTLESDSNDYNINGAIHYVPGTAFLISGPHRPKTVLFELDLFSEASRMKIGDNGAKVTNYSLLPGRYTGLSEYKEQIIQNCYPTLSPLLAAIEETANFPLTQNSCSGEDALEALRVALGLHYSAMNAYKIVALKELPEDYEVKTY